MSRFFDVDDYYFVSLFVFLRRRKGTLDTHYTSPVPSLPREDIRFLAYFRNLISLLLERKREKKGEKYFPKKIEKRSRDIYIFSFSFTQLLLFLGKRKETERNTLAFFFHSPARFLVISTTEKMFPFLLFQLNTHFFFF